jgi:hypothetical protein
MSADEMTFGHFYSKQISGQHGNLCGRREFPVFSPFFAERTWGRRRHPPPLVVGHRGRR